MDTGLFTKLAIGAVIMLLVVVSVITPILDGITYSTTEDNTPTGYATAAIPTGTIAVNSDGFTIDGGNTVAVSVGDWILLSDSLMIVKNSSSLTVTDFDAQISRAFTSIELQGNTWKATSSGTEYTGSIGSNPIIKAANGELGTYYDAPFVINKTDHAQMRRVSNSRITINDVTYNTVAIISGSLDALKVRSLGLTGNNSFIVADAEGATVSISPQSISEVSLKAYELAANPSITVNYTYGGQDYAYTGSQSSSIAAPLTYTVVTGNPIESMMGIVPLIMILGIITMVVGAFIIRRQ